MIERLGMVLDERGNVRAGDDGMAGVPVVFVAGDMRHGPSLVVWAITEGRRAADSIHRWVTAGP
jgi:glutamate synthase (NADPH) small chain